MSVLALEKHRNKPGFLAKLSPSNPARVVANNPAPSAVGAVIGTQIFNNISVASEVVSETVKVGGVTAAICTTLQFGSDIGSWFSGNIGAKEVGRRLIRNATVNGSAVVGGSGGAAVGGAIGTAIFPGTGTVLGSVIGGTFGSIGVGKLVNDKFEDWWRGYKVVYVQDSNSLLNGALQYFGYSPNDFHYGNDIITLESVTTRYREYAKVFHPDKGGSKEEWIALVTNFSIITDAIRMRDEGKKATTGDISRPKIQKDQESLLQIKEKEDMQKQIQSLKQQNQQLRQNNGNGANFPDFDVVDL